MHACRVEVLRRLYMDCFLRKFLFFYLRLMLYHLLENIENTRNTGTTKSGIKAAFVTRETTVTANVAIDIIFTSSLQNQKFMETSNLHNDTSYIDTSILVGIFMLCGLFVVLFAVFVGAQIRNKCFKRNNSTSQSSYGVYLKPYNLYNADQSLESEILPQVNINLRNTDSLYTVVDNYHVHASNKLIDPHPCQSNINVNLQAEEGSEQNKTWPKYIEVVASPTNSTCCDPGAEFSSATYVPMT